jgi:hypothetical protein
MNIVAKMMEDSPSYHPALHLLALERTGWRRWVFGRWVYKSEPFRRDIQRRCARSGLHTLHEEPWERWHEPDDAQVASTSGSTDNSRPVPGVGEK